MPFSQSSQISVIMNYVEQLNPSSVLDLGIGMGQYGFLMRTSLENVNLFEINGAHGHQRPRDQWRVKIDGVEGFAGYTTPVHAWAYNDVLISNVLDALPKIESGSYELVIGIDILEHFTTADGSTFLDHCKRVCSRAALISTPKTFHAQEVEANPLENHRSVWSSAELSGSGFRQVLQNEESWVVVYARSATDEPQ